MTNTTTAGSPIDELVIVRTFNAPRELVWQAWVDPAHSAKWSGPRGYSAPHQEADFRVGGAWRLCLRPDHGGEDLWQGGVYREITPPARLVFTFAWEGDDGRPENEMLVSLDFAEIDGKTAMTFRQSGFRSSEQHDGHRGGWNSAFDCLEEYLGSV